MKAIRNHVPAEVADEAEVSPQKDARVDRSIRVADVSVVDDAASGPSSLDRLVDITAAVDFEAEVDANATVRGDYILRPAIVRVVDGDSAQLRSDRPFLFGAGAAENVTGAPELRQLDGNETDAARGRRHKYAFARLEFAGDTKDGPCCFCFGEDGEGVHGADAGGKRPEIGRVGEAILSVGA